MDIRSSFDIGLYLLGGAVLIGAITVVGGAILYYERRRAIDLRRLWQAFSRVLIESPRLEKMNGE